MKGLGCFGSSKKTQKEHIWLNLSISSNLWLCEMCSSQYCDSINSFSRKVDLIAFFQICCTCWGISFCNRKIEAVVVRFGPLSRIHGSLKADSAAMQQIWHLFGISTFFFHMKGITTLQRKRTKSEYYNLFAPNFSFEGRCSDNMLPKSPQCKKLMFFLSHIRGRLRNIEIQYWII